MDNKYFNIRESVYEITEKYKEAIELLVSIGFENFRDENLRKNLGKSITLEDALKLKKINIEGFVSQLIERIEGNNENKDRKGSKGKEVYIAGVLPCPVKEPLMQAFQSFVDEEDFDFEIKYELKAASMGVDWLKDILRSGFVDKLPDIFISAGFDLFFDKDLFGKYKNEGIFEDITGITCYNRDFDNEYIKLKDPDNHYSMLGVVPAVFLVNQEELKGRQIPTSWEDLLYKPDYDASVSLPVGDFDLFNSILLNIYKIYGEEGIARLGKIMLSNMHPSQMVKSHIKRGTKPAVTIMPYFFTKLIGQGGPMLPVWPKDGAIISPIFMLSKKSKSEILKPIVDFFASKTVGEILSHNGRFPSVNPEVDNLIPRENKFLWLGWDFIKENDIGKLISKCNEIFINSLKEE